MNKIGIFFGTDSGSTRLIAKTIANKLGPNMADKPVNVNRITAEGMLQYDALILGTPTYGEGQLPGKSTKVPAGSWEEFLPQLKTHDLSNKIIAVYGLGDQEKYPERFANGMFQLYQQLKSCGATLTGSWSTAGYQFRHSAAVINGKFVGLALDNHSQCLLTDERIESWLYRTIPDLAKHMSEIKSRQVLRS